MITDDADFVSTPSPQLCALNEEEGAYCGFHLGVKGRPKGHITGYVVSGGAAERSGLRDGDRLLEVNNCYVDDVPHSESCLLVLDGVENDESVSRGQDLSDLARVHKGEGLKPPRLCHITRDPASGLGINFTPVEGEKGRFSVSLVAGGAAEKAGVCKGDLLVWMNGATVSDLTHSALSGMLNECGDHITILVIDSESEKNYMRQRMPILPTIAVPHKLPYRARKLHLLCGPEGYGFLLRLEKTLSGRTHHVLSEMDKGSPAERAGIQAGELLLEVNGESVESLKHEETVDKMRLSGQQVSLTTISPQGLEFYTQLGLSPLLFCEDDADERNKERSADFLSTTSPRLCALQREEGEHYGFDLVMGRGRQGHIIRYVVSGGVAERGGLRDGDSILEVNNCYVDDVPHSEVVKKMKLSGHHLYLLVLDGDAYEQAVSRGLDLRGLARMQKSEGLKPPRLCHITRDPGSGLGINFTPVEGEKGRFSVSLVAGGAAEKAGVCKGDLLVWMNGTTVSDLTHSALSRMMKKCGDHITILVIDSESEKNYMRQRMPILPTIAVPHKLPYRARKLHLLCGPEGYGFLLRLEKTPSGRTHHVLCEMDKGSPAERAGIQAGELLLGVNGESVESLKHEEIVDRMRLSGQQVSLTTISPQGLEFYTQLGLSPLLFCEDDADERNTERSTEFVETDTSYKTKKRKKVNCCLEWLDCGSLLSDCLFSFFE